MWNGKKKALTFSFDDGVEQDIRAIEILDKYGLKATFNICSNRAGKDFNYNFDNKIIYRHAVELKEIKQRYKNHEIACHTLDHVNLTTLNESEVIRQVEEDRKTLEKCVGYKILGMAYPNSYVNNNEKVAEIIKNNTPLKYARVIYSSYNFNVQKNLYQFEPSLHFADDHMGEFIKNFVDLKTEEPKLFTVWGHTYEMDAGYIDYDMFEQYCKDLANRDDIFYGTNSEVILDK